MRCVSKQLQISVSLIKMQAVHSHSKSLQYFPGVFPPQYYLLESSDDDHKIDLVLQIDEKESKFIFRGLFGMKILI